jgi:hypothetical protein
MAVATKDGRSSANRKSHRANSARYCKASDLRKKKHPHICSVAHFEHVTVLLNQKMENYNNCVRFVESTARKQFRVVGQPSAKSSAVKALRSYVFTCPGRVTTTSCLRSTPVLQCTLERKRPTRPQGTCWLHPLSCYTENHGYKSRCAIPSKQHCDAAD